MQLTITIDDNATVVPGMTTEQLIANIATELTPESLDKLAHEPQTIYDVYGLPAGTMQLTRDAVHLDAILAHVDAC